MFGDIVAKCRAWIFVAFLVATFPLLLVVCAFRAVLRPLWEKRKNISGEVALITGSANGLGKEIAIKLAAQGCHIAIVDINEEAAKTTATLLGKTYNVKVKAFKADVTKYEEVAALAKNVEEQLGPVSILVNNAGMLVFSKSPDAPPKEIQQMINTNLTAHVWMVRVFLEKMKRLGKGHIVAISSISGFVPCHRQMEYTATKFAVRGLMQALQTEIYAQDCEFIKTTTVFPFFLKTHSQVLQMYEKMGMNSAYPSISGVEAANDIVEGVVTNQSEVFIPRVFEPVIKFLEFLPKEWYMFLLNNSMGREKMRAIEW